LLVLSLQKQVSLKQVTTWYNSQITLAAYIKLGTKDATLNIKANKDMDGVIKKAINSGATLNITLVNYKLISSVLKNKVD
jgi:hypothetical protein